MTEKDKILRRLLVKIQKNESYHKPMDIALVDWLSSNASVQEISEKYDVQPAALYTQRSRLARMQESAGEE